MLEEEFSRCDGNFLDLGGVDKRRGGGAGLFVGFIKGGLL